MLFGKLLLTSHTYEITVGHNMLIHFILICFRSLINSSYFIILMTAVCTINISFTGSNMFYIPPIIYFQHFPCNCIEYCSESPSYFTCISSIRVIIGGRCTIVCFMCRRVVKHSPTRDNDRTTPGYLSSQTIARVVWKWFP